MATTTEYNFWSEVDSLSKITSKRLFNRKVKLLKEFCFGKHNNYYPFRLALELDRKGLPIEDLEDYIITLATAAGSWHWNARYLFSVAVNCKSANIQKLQAAAIKIKHSDVLTDFLCFVKNCDESLLQDILLNDLKVPKSAATLLQFYKKVDVERARNVIMNSPRRAASRYLYALGKHTSDPKDLAKIEDLLLKNLTSNKRFYYVRLWIKNVKGANVQLFEDRVIATKNMDEIYKMFEITGSKRLARYCLLL